MSENTSNTPNSPDPVLINVTPISEGGAAVNSITEDVCGEVEASSNSHNDVESGDSMLLTLRKEKDELLKQNAILKKSQNQKAKKMSLVSTLKEEQARLLLKCKNTRKMTVEIAAESGTSKPKIRIFRLEISCSSPIFQMVNKSTQFFSLRKRATHFLR